MITIKDTIFQIENKLPINIDQDDFEVILDSYYEALSELKAQFEKYPDYFPTAPTMEIIAQFVILRAKERLLIESEEDYREEIENSNEPFDVESLADYQMEYIGQYVDYHSQTRWQGVRDTLEFANLCWAEETGHYDWNQNTTYDIMNSPQVNILELFEKGSTYQSYYNSSEKLIKKREDIIYSSVYESVLEDIWIPEWEV